MKISLKKKKISTTKESYFIEYYNGSTIDENGKRKHFRKFEYLNLHLLLDPKTALEKKKNKETTLLAENIFAIKKTKLIQGKYDIQDTEKGKILFLDYYAQIRESKAETSKNNYDNWYSAEKHLIKYCPPHIRLNEVDSDFVNGFKEYLEKKARTSANRPLAQNSKYSYFNKFKACIKEAFNESYITKDVTKKAKSFEQQESQREYLTHSELQAISSTECKYEVLKRAFIFSCLTGLRWSDVNKLTWSEVRDEDEGSRIIFRQKKTDGLEYLYISKQARSLLGKRGLLEERAFVGLRYSSTFNNELLRWMMRSGITKHVTFHSARHTNAVLLLENGADIYTVQKRLGHKEIRTTEIYAKIIDSKMKEASEIIPELNIEL